MKTGTVFYKMSGSGNDFIMVDGRYAHADDFTAESVKAACDRRQGIGADGIILLDPEAPPGVDFTFRFWNADGSLGPMCGNGALCATRLAVMLGIVPRRDRNEVIFATRAGLHRGRLEGDRPEIFLPDCPAPRPVKVPLEAGELEPMFAEPSVPHLVLQVANVETIDVAGRGPTLRFDGRLPPGGANVNWISPAARGGADGWRMRTYERGVEGETLACGTGAVASALVLGAVREVKSPTRIWTSSGLPLDVSWRRAGEQITDLSLSGEARVTFKGTVGEPLSLPESAS